MSAIARFVAAEPAVVPAGDLGGTVGVGLAGRPTPRGVGEVGLPRAPEGPLEGETTAAKVVPAALAAAIRGDALKLMRSVQSPSETTRSVRLWESIHSIGVLIAGMRALESIVLSNEVLISLYKCQVK